MNSRPSLESALALHRAGQLVDAEAAYRACLVSGQPAAAPSLGVVLLQQGRFAEAAALLAPLSTSAPADFELATNLSLAARRSGDLPTALDAAERAVAAAPQRVSTWNALGLVHFEQSDFTAAEHAFRQGLLHAPDHPALVLHLAQCLRRMRRPQEAEPLFARLSRTEPRMLEAWRGLAATQGALGKTVDALASARAARALAPDDLDVRLELCVACLQADVYVEAAQELERLLAERDQDPRLWTWLGTARMRAEDYSGAHAALQKAAALQPDNAVVAHLLAATSGQLPDAVEADYIRGLFDDFADRFESTLVGKLAYATPSRLASLMRAHFTPTGDVLDLGCGTGLMAVELAGDAVRIDGVDLSSKMLQHARDKQCYRELHEAEVLQFLESSEREWDLIIAADVFVYVAELQPIFAAAWARLRPGGWFAFSVERSATDATELLAATARYRHSPALLHEQLRAVGFSSVGERVELRQEYAKPVMGELILAQRMSA
jgi:predicted TPR repeat methyltransferase